VIWVIGSLELIGNVTIQYSSYDFLFTFHRKYAPVLYRFRNIAIYFVSYLSCIWRPLTLSEFD